MNALVFDGVSLRLDAHYPTPQRAKGESLVRVSLAGICSTDREILKGYNAFRGVPGHEFVGVVEDTDAPQLAGRRVVGEINCPCGVCPRCAAGLGKHCAARSVLGIQGRDGAFAEYLVLPDGNLHPVPDGVPDEDAVFTEPLAAAFEVTQSVHVAPSDRVLVVGAGRLGKLVLQVLRGTGCTLVAAVRRAGDVEPLAAVDIEAVISEQLETIPLFDVVVECAGTVEGFAVARRMVRPRGTIVQKSTYNETVDIDISSLVVDEVRLVGSRCGPFAPALRALASGQVRVSSLVSRTFPLEKAEEAFTAASSGEKGKVLLKII